MLSARIPRIRLLVHPSELEADLSSLFACRTMPIDEDKNRLAMTLQLPVHALKLLGIGLSVRPSPPLSWLKPLTIAPFINGLLSGSG